MATSFLGFDFGNKRIGLALADSEVRFSNPLITLQNDSTVFSRVGQIIKENNVTVLVVGLPRSLNGNETEQTALARQFADRLGREFALPVYLIDEAATSIEASAELKSLKRQPELGEIDKLAATIILEDFLANYHG